MKHLHLPLAVVATISGFCLVAAGDKLTISTVATTEIAQNDPGKKAGGKKEAGKKDSAKKDSAKKDAEPSAKTPDPKTAPAATPKRSPDEEAVLLTGAALVKAYNARDSQAFAGVFTADGEYVDEKGAVYHGRKALESEFDGFFKANPETSIEVAFVSTRAIAPGIIAADGTTRFTRAKSEPPVAGRCSLVCTKEGGKWLIASLREVEAADEHTSHHEQVRQLEFMLGDWIDEGAGSHVHFTCRWDEGQNFLLRDFAVVFAGQKTMTGTQRIGYDPLTGHLKAWIFDSAGGYADGYFHSEGEKWILQTSGVTSDGRMASGTQIFARDEKHRMSWQAVDYVIGGERIPDIPKVTIVRKPPTPTSTAK
jgi:uncharacterized protein (TIGR02246 family)